MPLLKYGMTISTGHNRQHKKKEKMIKHRSIRRMVLTLAVALTALGVMAQHDNPKREFRGAWLHVIGQTQYQKMGTDECKRYISDQLDRLQAAGCNAVIFQVRPTADALYESELEPWSSWLTGARGKAPQPAWDPLQYTLDEAHKRGMEFHAWLNPYRVTSNSKEVLPSGHAIHKEPHRFVKFNGQVFFDPAYKENRDFICDVVRDIVNRYDVDGIHIDDYFYPYPADGRKFNGDDASYAKLGHGMDRNEWRRHNVDMLIEQLHGTIKGEKDWVRFGVSPFGIWRNKKSDPRGSNSTGLQNYDDLYADVLLWAEEGWIDYLAPQLYWTLDMKAAPSRHLAEWWDANVSPKVDIYIGQDTKRTMDNPDPRNNDRNELDTKVKLSRRLPNVKGNVWWHGYWVTDNYKGVADSLAMKYQSTIALPPVYGDPVKQPDRISNLQLERTEDGMFLTWDVPSEGGMQLSTDPIRFVVYEFFPGEDTDGLEDPQTIIALTPYRRVRVGDCDSEELEGVTFAVTALDRMNRESEPVRLRL